MLSFLKTKQSCSKCRVLSIWRWLASTSKLNAKQIFRSLFWLQPCPPIDCYTKKNLAPHSVSSLSLSLSLSLSNPASPCKYSLKRNFFSQNKKLNTNTPQQQQQWHYTRIIARSNMAWCSKKVENFLFLPDRVFLPAVILKSKPWASCVDNSNSSGSSGSDEDKRTLTEAAEQHFMVDKKMNKKTKSNNEQLQIQKMGETQTHKNKTKKHRQRETTNRVEEKEILLLQY